MPDIASGKMGDRCDDDILFWRKRLPGDVAGDRGWTDVRPTTMPNKNGMDITGNVSAYFLDHPEMILGEHGFFDTLYQELYALRMRGGQDKKPKRLLLSSGCRRTSCPTAAGPGRDDQGRLRITEKKEGTYYPKLN